MNAAGSTNLRVVYRAGRTRRLGVIVCAACACYVAHVLLGNTGSGLAFLGCLSRWRRHDWGRSYELIALGEVEHYWRVQRAVALKFATGGWHWVFRDEVLPREYAALRRYAKLKIVRQPVGLSISR